jgi:tetratricopeptide (TPR) repeat protein
VLGVAVLVCSIGIRLFLRGSIWYSENSFWQAAVLEHPNISNIRVSLGVSYIGRNEGDKALLEYVKAQELDPENDLAFVNAAFLLGALHRSEQAIMFAEKAHILNPGSQLNRNELADLYAQAGRATEEAKLRQNDATYYHDMGNYYIQQKDYGAAEHAYRYAETLNPARAETHGNLGALLLTTERYTEAIAELTKATELNPNYADAYYNLSVAYQKQQQHPSPPEKK